MEDVQVNDGVVDGASLDTYREGMLNVSITYPANRNFDCYLEVTISSNAISRAATERDLVDSISDIINGLAEQNPNSSCEFKVNMCNVLKTLVNDDNIKNFARPKNDDFYGRILSIEIKNPITQENELLNVMWLTHHNIGEISLSVESLVELQALWKDIAKRLDFE